MGFKVLSLSICTDQYGAGLPAECDLHAWRDIHSAQRNVWVVLGYRALPFNAASDRLLICISRLEGSPTGKFPFPSNRNALAGI